MLSTLTSMKRQQYFIYLRDTTTTSQVRVFYLFGYDFSLVLLLIATTQVQPRQLKFEYDIGINNYGTPIHTQLHQASTLIMEHLLTYV
jgi:hypothetical protein